MSNDTPGLAPQLGVLVMDDGGPFGDAAIELMRRVRPSSVRLAVTGAPEQRALRTVRTVAPEKFTLRTAVRAAAGEGLFWIMAPPEVPDPLTAFVDAARGAAGELDEFHPGFAVAFADPTRPVERIALVADLNDPVTTGMAVWAAVGAAILFRARLDFLVIGADSTRVPPDRETALSMFSLRGGSEALIRAALERADEYGITVAWRALGSPANKPGAILNALEEGHHDLVIDDLPPINVGPKVGRRRRVQAALSQAGSSSTAYRLLRDAPCGVVVVLDAVRLGLVPMEVVKAAGVATLAMGIVGGAVAASGAAAAETTTQMTSTDTNVASGAVADAQAQAFDPTGMTAEDLSAMQVQQDQAAASRDQAAAQLSAEQATQAQIAEQLTTTQAQIQQLQPQLDAATAATSEAAMQAAYTATMTTGPMAMLPGGPTVEDARAAQTAADEARAQEDALQSSMDALVAQQDQLSQSQAQLDAEIAQTQQELATATQSADTLSSQVDQLAFHLNPVVVPTEAGWSISSTFGESGGSWSSGYHTGLDFAQPYGADVYAAKDGVVVEAGWGGAYGNTIVIEHSDGTRTMYNHLQEINVSVGQTVSAGETIGAVGSTGNSSGPHLHFEVIDPSGQQIDPAPWLGLA